MKNEFEKIQGIIDEAIEKHALKKIVFSIPVSHDILRAEAALFEKSDRLFINYTEFRKDGKSLRRNYTAGEAPEVLANKALNDFKRCNIITLCGECQVMISKNGKVTVIDRIKHENVSMYELEIPGHDRQKKYIIDAANSKDFLYGLGISDENGNVFDRKMSKFRQINKFLEVVRDVYDSLPPEGELTVCDLCCGKSYLTFALYHYLTCVKGRKVNMYGVDLKSDVICYCGSLAEKLGYSGMHFISGDISAFTLTKDADMVVSLHACDIATDIVLMNAIRLKAKVILSTPCCHHELNRQLDCKELAFVTRHSILRQKLADALTDSLRVLALESKGYEVAAFELIDPEETPKNVIIRAIYKNTPQEKRKKAADEFTKSCEFLGVKPFIAKIMID